MHDVAGFGIHNVKTPAGVLVFRPIRDLGESPQARFAGPALATDRQMTRPAAIRAMEAPGEVLGVTYDVGDPFLQPTESRAYRRLQDRQIARVHRGRPRANSARRVILNRATLSRSRGRVMCHAVRWLCVGSLLAALAATTSAAQTPKQSRPKAAPTAEQVDTPCPAVCGPGSSPSSAGGSWLGRAGNWQRPPLSSATD